MLTPAQHTRRAILKAFKRLSIGHVDNTRKDDECGQIQWLDGDATCIDGAKGYWHFVTIYSDGTASGVFPPEMFSFFCPEV